jgi:hypothetical protein
MATGLIALLDDVTALAKMAAASLDDVAAGAAKAGAKAAGVVVDDAAVTPRYLVGFAASRELPVVWRIARGSARNKLLILLPAALALQAFLPSAIGPLLMLGAGFLCYEGAEKVYEAIWPHAAHAHEAATSAAGGDPQALEDEKVASAIKTDFILSAEIMAITLAATPDGSLLFKAMVLLAVALGITAAVYGAVALIVKADDAGVALAGNPRPVSTLLGLRTAPAGRAGGADRALAPLTTALGRGLVRGMPPFLKALAALGTAAMLWVGGGILLHELEVHGLAGPAHLVHEIAAAAGRAVPAIGGAVEWIVNAAGSGVVGLAVGAALIPLVEHVIAPVFRRLRGTPATPGAQAH